MPNFGDTSHTQRAYAHPIFAHLGIIRPRQFSKLITWDHPHQISPLGTSLERCREAGPTKQSIRACFRSAAPKSVIESCKKKTRCVRFALTFFFGRAIHVCSVVD